MKKYARYLLLVLILFLGFALRVYKLSDIPQGFFCDEAAVGYNAYTILHTGRDEYGVPLPIFFRSFGDYKTPVLIYSAVPFIALFGMTEFSVRITSVFWGMMTIVTMYFLGREVDRKNPDSFGLLSAFVAATMPWLIHYNRTGFDINTYSAFFTATAYFFIRAQREKQWIMPAWIVGGLTLYTYNPERLLIPLFFIGICAIYRKECMKHIRIHLIGLGVLGFMSIPLVLSLAHGEGLSMLEMAASSSGNLSVWQRIPLFIQHYVYQLSPQFFFRGDPTVLTRHFVGGFTPVLFVTLPFAVAGLTVLFVSFLKDKTKQFLLYWFFLYPIAGAVATDGGPLSSRSVIGASIVTLLIVIGVMWVVSNASHAVRRYMLPFIVSMIVVNVIVFARFYFFRYPVYASGFTGWQYGAKDIVQYFAAHQNTYQDMYMGAEPEFSKPEEFFKFYAPGDCATCRVGYPDSAYRANRRQLFAVAPDYMLSHQDFTYTIRYTIHYPDKRVAFFLVEVTLK